MLSTPAENGQKQPFSDYVFYVKNFDSGQNF